MKNALVQIEACSLTCPGCGEAILSSDGSDMHTPSELQISGKVKCQECGLTLGVPTFILKQDRGD